MLARLQNAGAAVEPEQRSQPSQPTEQPATENAEQPNAAQKEKTEQKEPEQEEPLPELEAPASEAVDEETITKPTRRNDIPSWARADTFDDDQNQEPKQFFAF